MQSLTSKYAKAHERGRALGVFATYAYAGSFAGGVLGGVLYHYLGIMWIGVIIAVICVLWLGSFALLASPTKQKNLYLPISEYDRSKISTLESKDGIIEIYTNDTEGVIVLKYRSDILSTQSAQAIADTIKKPQWLQSLAKRS